MQYDIVYDMFRGFHQIQIEIDDTSLSISRPAAIAHQDSQLLNITINKQLTEYTHPLLKKVIYQMESKYGLENPFKGAHFEISKKEIDTQDSLKAKN